MGDTDQETSLLHYVAGLMEIKRSRMTEAESHFRKALSKTTGADRWSYLMAMAGLEDLLKTQLEGMPDSPAKTAYQSEVKAFTQSIHNNWIDRIGRNL